MKKIYFSIIAFFLLAITSGVAQYSVLLNFAGASSPKGMYPWGTLTLIGKKLYGMTSGGGANGYGCVFSMDTTGSNYKDLMDFNNTNGFEPQFSSFVYSKGVLYGMTYGGGVYGGGIIFSIDTDGTHYRDMYNFGATYPNPTASLILVGKKLYGMTPYGGPSGMGNIFSIDTNATAYTDLHDFSSGEYPYGSLIILGKKLYGGATYAGANSDGYLFSIDTNGSGFRDIFDFNGTNGKNPLWGGALIFLQGKFYGMACNGGASTYGCIFSLDTNGSGYSDLVDFTGMTSPDYGANPSGSLIASGKYLLGLTPNFGVNGGGTLFMVDTNGSGYTDLYDFSNSTGTKPYGALTQSGSSFYGTCQSGGSNSDGVIFKFNQILTAANNIEPLSAATVLYPNPNNGSFNLSISHAVPNNSGSASHPIVEIYNMLGEKVYNTSLSAQRTTLSIDQPAGVYLYRVLTETGTLVSEGRFIVQK